MKFYVGDKFPSITGVYLISFDGSDKVYIGSTCANGRCIYENGFGVRWRNHLYRLRSKKHEKKLQNAYNKYGEKNIYFKIIEKCDKNIQFDREQFWINKFNSYKNGYNSCPNSKPKQSFLNTKKAKEKRDSIRKINSEKKESIILELYKKNLSNLQICEITKFNPKTVSKYLFKNKIKNLNGKFNRAKEVYCFNIKTLEIKKYKSVHVCALELNLKKANIHAILNKVTKSRTIHGYSFSRKELTLEQFQNFIIGGNRWHPKPKN